MARKPADPSRRKRSKPAAPAKRRRAAGSSDLPTREEILAFIAEHPGKVGKREIARAFGIAGGARIALKGMLKSLAEEGMVEGPHQRLKRPGDLPSVSVLEVLRRDRDGDLLAAPVEWPEERGKPPMARVVVPKAARGRDVPGVGSRILARLHRTSGEEADYEARVVKVLPQAQRAVLGVVRQQGQVWRIEPVDRKQPELVLDPGDAKLREGDLVAVAVSRDGRYGLKRGSVTEVIGSMKNEKAVSLIALQSHGIPYRFPDDALAEAEAAKPATMRGREDWRDLPLVTIDPADAKDHDDAVHAAPDEDAANAGGFVVTVAIADVAAYVRPGSRLDAVALDRGNSVYFPDRVVPMLPERISNDLCSLREGVDRPALAVRMVFDANGRLKAHGFHRVMMRSAARLSYRQAQDAFDGDPGDLDPGVADALGHLWAAYRTLARARDDRAPLDLDLPERKVLLDANGHIDRVVSPERLEAHRLIEEFMIQANVAAAETLEGRKSPLVYRIHDNPSLAKLEALREFLKSIELNFPHRGNLRPSHFNLILGRTRETEHAQMVSEVVLRTQSQAEYSPENIGHFGLNLRRYAHFTSPIRRYADLIVHRALIRALGLGKDGLTDETVAGLPEIAARISAAERRAMAAERDTIDRLVAHWMADRVGAVFPGRISGVTRAGLFARLDESGADGFIPASTLGRDYFVHDEARHALIGEKTHEMFRLGDTVEVKLVEAVPLTGGLRFEMVSPGRTAAPHERPPRRTRAGLSGGRRPPRARRGKH